MKRFKGILIAALTISTAFLLYSCGESNASKDSGSSTPVESNSEELAANQEEKTLGIGDSETVEGITYTLVSVQLTEERNQFDKTNPVQVVEIVYTINNGSDKDYPYGTDITVYDAAGKKCDTYPLSDSLNMGSLAAGRSVDCKIY